MYFPYFRGKQYELLALKELSQLLGSEQMVKPIIEPVRELKKSGLSRCLGALSNDKVEFVLVINPSVGELKGGYLSDDLLTFIKEREEETSWNLGLLLHETTDVRELFKQYKKCLGSGFPLTLIHRGLVAEIDSVPDLTMDLYRAYDVIDDKLRRRHFSELLTTSKGVTLRDGFPAESRNSDFQNKAESIFSEEHLYYSGEDWYGFADFATIGSNYSEGGYAPRVVVIHWTYEPKPGKPVMIRHFTSEDDGGTGNVGGKFLEAARELVAFLDVEGINTVAAGVVRTHVEGNTYPGLGIIKKLSIQNHLELVSTILSRS